MNLKKYLRYETQVFSQVASVATLKKFRLNSTLYFQGGTRTHFFETKNRVQIKDEIVIIHKIPLCNGNCPITDPITEMRVEHTVVPGL